MVWSSQYNSVIEAPLDVTSYDIWSWIFKLAYGKSPILPQKIPQVVLPKPWFPCRRSSRDTTELLRSSQITTTTRIGMHMSDLTAISLVGNSKSIVRMTNECIFLHCELNPIEMVSHSSVLGMGQVSISSSPKEDVWGGEAGCDCRDCRH